MVGLRFRKSFKIAPGVRLNVSNKSTALVSVEKDCDTPLIVLVVEQVLWEFQEQDYPMFQRNPVNLIKHPLIKNIKNFRHYRKQIHEIRYRNKQSMKSIYTRINVNLFNRSIKNVTNQSIGQVLSIAHPLFH